MSVWLFASRQPTTATFRKKKGVSYQVNYSNFVVILFRRKAARGWFQIRGIMGYWPTFWGPTVCPPPDGISLLFYVLVAVIDLPFLLRRPINHHRFPWFTYLSIYSPWATWPLLPTVCSRPDDQLRRLTSAATRPVVVLKYCPRSFTVGPREPVLDAPIFPENVFRRHWLTAISLFRCCFCLWTWLLSSLTLCAYSDTISLYWFYELQTFADGECWLFDPNLAWRILSFGWFQSEGMRVSHHHHLNGWFPSSYSNQDCLLYNLKEREREKKTQERNHKTINERALKWVTVVIVKNNEEEENGKKKGPTVNSFGNDIYIYKDIINDL